jgi:hypothetical protein
MRAADGRKDLEAVEARREHLRRRALQVEVEQG